MDCRALALALSVLLVACAKDEGPLHVPRHAAPDDPVDTAYFGAEVLPILTARCWTCHPPMGGMDLSASEAYANLVGVESSNHAPALRVVPGDPEASVLWNKINFTEVYGLGMPPDGTVLSPAEVATITDWIEQGALDN
ncbi:MAG: c-type cytochrome domain-containing protein [Flavobacteriales bacterium]|nr:MAG: c-type cytochrome domain-containing protein [Flavobacteriales bacterium]